MQIYSLAKGVCCKAIALVASALATNTLVSAINLYQCSAWDLNHYITRLVDFHKSAVKSFWHAVSQMLPRIHQCSDNPDTNILPTPWTHSHFKLQQICEISLSSIMRWWTVLGDCKAADIEMHTTESRSFYCLGGRTLDVVGRVSQGKYMLLESYYLH